MLKYGSSVVAVGLLLAACSGFGSEDEENRPPAPTPEDNAKPPPEVEGKPIEGIYVSASQGRPDATGFPGSPLKTIAAGLLRAKEKNLRLIVCAEEYLENVEVIDGVSAYGYYDCSAALWKRGNKHATIRAPQSPALLARDLKVATRFEGFDIIAPDLEKTTAVDREGSSVGVDARNIGAGIFFISDSILHGGKGAAGADGAPAVAPTASGTARGTDGIGASFASCPNQMLMNCTNPLLQGVPGPSISCGDTEPAPGPGGAGGDGMWLLDGEPSPNIATNLFGRPIPTTPLASQFGTPCSGQVADTCAKGVRGVDGGAGKNGANGTWKFDANGLVLGNGTRGLSGAPGQGGQGGGSARRWWEPGVGYSVPPANIKWARTPRGGSGGSGGCGGLAGGAGGGGGASIGLLAIDAVVTLERDLVESSNGGRAGAGTLGGAGKVGGAGGTGGDGVAGIGGDGGSGGRGGASGHGAAGPSIALVFKGARPNVAPGVELRQGLGGEGRNGLFEPPNIIETSPIGASLAELEIQP